MCDKYNNIMKYNKRNDNRETQRRKKKSRGLWKRTLQEPLRQRRKLRMWKQQSRVVTIISEDKDQNQKC